MRNVRFRATAPLLLPDRLACLISPGTPDEPAAVPMPGHAPSGRGRIAHRLRQPAQRAAGADRARVPAVQRAARVDLARRLDRRAAGSGEDRTAAASVRRLESAARRGRGRAGEKQITTLEIIHSATPT